MGGYECPCWRTNRHSDSDVVWKAERGCATREDDGVRRFRMSYGGIRHPFASVRLYRQIRFGHVGHQIDAYGANERGVGVADLLDVLLLELAINAVAEVDDALNRCRPHR